MLLIDKNQLMLDCSINFLYYGITFIIEIAEFTQSLFIYMVLGDECSAAPYHWWRCGAH